MARHIEVFGVCDICGTRLPETDMRMDVTLLIEGQGGECDLCPPCRDELSAVTERFVSVLRPPRRDYKTELDANGKPRRYVTRSSGKRKPPTRPAPSDRPNGENVLTCEICGYVAKALNGLGIHRIRAHGQNWTTKGASGKGQPAQRTPAPAPVSSVGTHKKAAES